MPKTGEERPAENLVAVLQTELFQTPFDSVLASTPAVVPISDAPLDDGTRHIGTYWVTNDALPPAGRLSVYATRNAGPRPSQGEPGPYSTRYVIPVDRGCLDSIVLAGARLLADLPEIEEPGGPEAHDQSHLAAGVVLIDDDGKFTLVEPRAHFGGYTNTFPKGRVDPSDASFQAAARRQLCRKTGLRCQIVGFVGDFPGDTSVTRYYLSMRTGGRTTASGTTAAVKRVGAEEALGLLNRERDRDVLRRAIEVAAAAGTWTWRIDDLDHHCQLLLTQPPRLRMVPDEEQMMDAEITKLGGTGVWAAQFGPGQHRLWFVPKEHIFGEELYDRVAGIIARELGKHVMLSALWLYPGDALARDAPRASAVFMYHLVARDHSHRSQTDGDYERISQAIIGQLADLSLEHWPPAVGETGVTRP